MESLSSQDFNVEENLDYQEDLAETEDNSKRQQLKHNHREESAIEENVIEELSEVNSIIPKYNGNGPIPYEGNEFSYL